MKWLTVFYFFLSSVAQHITEDPMFRIEGDILIRTSTFHYYYKERHLAIKKTWTSGKLNYWSHGRVPYTFSKDFTDEQKNRIKKAFDEMQNKTCVIYVEIDPNHYPYNISVPNYVQITSHDKGCFATIGQQFGQQQLNLGNGCVHTNTIIHEMMHTLGFWHEHVRPDRDDFINVHWEAIPEDQEHNFWKQSTTFEDGTPYDFNSIMHYLPSFFCLNQ